MLLTDGSIIFASPTTESSSTESNHLSYSVETNMMNVCCCVESNYQLNQLNNSNKRQTNNKNVLIQPAANAKSSVPYQV